MKKLFLFLSLSLVFIPAAFAQSNATTLTIATYYPSPYGVYRNVRLYPTPMPTSGVTPGVMYYNVTDNKVKYYNGTAWVNLTIAPPCKLVAFPTPGTCDVGWYTFGGMLMNPTGNMLCCRTSN